MLPSAHRLRESDHFGHTVRRGVRAGKSTMVVHLGTHHDIPDGPALVGFVVSKAVGNAVTRNKVKRRLRAITREHLNLLHPGEVIVVRALPTAATARYELLERDYVRLVSMCRRKRGARA